MQKLCIYFMHNLEQLYYSNFTYHVCVLCVCPFSVHNLPVEVNLCKNCWPLYILCSSGGCKGIHCMTAWALLRRGKHDK